jgi:V8-like Glu-specific endopeptidase
VPASLEEREKYAETLRCEAETLPGMSGSPVWIRLYGYKTAVAIQ